MPYLVLVLYIDSFILIGPIEKSKFQGLFKALTSNFLALFNTDLIFKDFSRKHSLFKYFSRLC